MKLLNPTDANPFNLLDQFFDIGLNGANTARNYLKPLVSTGSTCESTAQLNFHEDEHHYHALLDLPGVNKKDVHIEVEDGKLVISATRKNPFGTEDQTDSSYKRTLRLGDQVDSTKIHATLEDGVLHVTLPKLEKAKVRTVKIN